MKHLRTSVVGIVGVAILLLAFTDARLRAQGQRATRLQQIYDQVTAIRAKLTDMTNPQNENVFLATSALYNYQCVNCTISNVSQNTLTVSMAMRNAGGGLVYEDTRTMPPGVTWIYGSNIKQSTRCEWRYDGLRSDVRAAMTNDNISAVTMSIPAS